ncbi:polyisoprenoid-binding protein YceI [Fluviicoccus keumensis]|uniref:Polyisoprenoid-binding protein YceI n=2 Tax=Fluviicoccus keumensis TaxID=1435465 RepID=A0A4Q7ZD59_9GAMM|nr:polyisoprenoid-binding protein YceI [Fluviicoccus keumensis]
MTATAVSAAATSQTPPDPDPNHMPAGVYKLDKAHASIIARVLHQGFAWYTFRFDNFDVAYAFDPKSPEASRVQVTVDPRSMNTGNAKADKSFPVDFLKADFFPKVTFVSTAIKYAGNGKGTVTGDLTLAGVTRPQILDVTFLGSGKDMFGVLRTGFSAKTVITRSAFDSTAYIPLVGDAVELMIDVEFIKKPDQS